jgi:hypothetical protein
MRQTSPCPPCPNPACTRPHVVRNGHLAGVRRYHRRSPAMAAGLTEHVWSWEEFLNIPVPIST